MVIIMKVRLGYVALPLTIDITSSKTITYTHFKEKKDIEGYHHIDNLIKTNLDSLMEILKYNVRNDIHFYRLTSNLIPLATLEEVPFDYINPYLKKYHEIGEYALKNNLRLDFHPDQYCILNSTNPKVVKGAIEILKYHNALSEAFKFKDAKLILHIGSSQGGKKASLTRFKNNFLKLPGEIRQRIVLENDDKVFNVVDTLRLCEELKVPMVLDYHHFLCNNNKELIRDYYEKIFATWKSSSWPPKVHFSSPKNKTKKDFRSHHDYIDTDSFISFLEEVKDKTSELDIMIEAKKKDLALFRLVRSLKYKTNYRFIDSTTFIVE